MEYRTCNDVHTISRLSRPPDTDPGAFLSADAEMKEAYIGLCSVIETISDLCSIALRLR